MVMVITTRESRARVKCHVAPFSLLTDFPFSLNERKQEKSWR